VQRIDGTTQLDWDSIIVSDVLDEEGRVQVPCENEVYCNLGLNSDDEAAKNRKRDRFYSSGTTSHSQDRVDIDNEDHHVIDFIVSVVLCTVLSCAQKMSTFMYCVLCHSFSVLRRCSLFISAFFQLRLHQVLATVESSFLFADTAPAVASATWRQFQLVSWRQLQILLQLRLHQVLEQKYIKFISVSILETVSVSAYYGFVSDSVASS
jgi:hypothetical protein